MVRIEWFLAEKRASVYVQNYSMNTHRTDCNFLVFSPQKKIRNIVPYSVTDSIFNILRLIFFSSKNIWTILVFMYIIAYACKVYTVLVASNYSAMIWWAHTHTHCTLRTHCECAHEYNLPQTILQQLVWSVN